MPSFPKAPFLYAILDAGLKGSRTWTEWVELVAGPERAGLVQLRAKALPDVAFVEAAREVGAACARARVPFIVNDRPDIARVVGADGVHVGQWDLTPSEIRTLLPDAIVGVSTHDGGQLAGAIASPADYIAVGPVFATTTKANPDPVVGLDFVRRAASLSDRPVVAIGGITTANARDVAGAGARGVAVISALMSHGDPRSAASAFVRSLRGAEDAAILRRQ